MNRKSMSFVNVHNGINIDCIKHADEIGDDIYIMKIGSDKATEKDFRSKYEKGVKPKENTCKTICMYRGISINKLVDAQSESKILERYVDMFKVSPKSRKYYCKFKLINNAGKVRHTPNRHDKSHNTFYKEDKFSVQLNIQIIQENQIPYQP